MIFDFKEEDTITKKISNGVIVSFFATIISRVLDFVSAIIITRVLLPEDFGLLSVSMAIILFSTKTTQTGFDSALIQRQHNPEELFNTAWTLELIKGFILFQLLYWGAPLLSVMFDDARLIPILKWLSILFLFTGMKNIGVINFRKHLNFQKLSIFELVPLTIKTISVVLFTLVLKNVWALVYTQIIVSFSILVLSFIIHPYRPKLSFDLVKTRELFNFGKWILGSYIINTIKEQGLLMFIVRYIDVFTLGIYDRASAFSKKIYMSFIQMFWKVCYPAFSKISQDLVKLRKVYLLSIKLMMFIGAPIVSGAIIFGNDFISLVLTDRWEGILPLFYLFSLNGLLGFIHVPAGISFQAIGKPKIGTTIAMYGTLVLILLLYPLTDKYGIEGTVTALLASNSIVVPFAIYRLSNLINFGMVDFFKQIYLSTFSTILMALILIFLKINIYYVDSIMDLIAYFFISILLYSSISIFLDKFSNIKILNIVISLLQGKIKLDDYDL